MPRLHCSEAMVIKRFKHVILLSLRYLSTLTCIREVLFHVVAGLDDRVERVGE